MYESGIKNKAEFFSNNFKNFLFTVNITVSLFLIAHVLIYLNSQLLRFDLNPSNNFYTKTGELFVLICIILSGYFTLYLKSFFFYLIFNLNMIILNFKLIQVEYQKDIMTCVFSLFIIFTNIILSFYSAYFYLQSRGYLKQFDTNNYFETFRNIGEEIEVRLDLIKININNIIINSGLRKYLRLIMFKLDDYSFTSYTVTQEEIQSKKVDFATNTSCDNLNSKSTIDTEFN